MFIVRESLIEPKEKTVVSTYSNISLHTGNCFIESAAKEENTKLGGQHKIVVTNEQHPENPDLTLHYATLHDANDQPAIRFYAEWPMEDDYDDNEASGEPDTITEGALQI